MNIYYNDKDLQWETDTSETITFGKNKYLLWQRNNICTTCFRMKLVNKKVGPLIGILTSKENRKTFYGNRETFINIQNALQKLGGISFVFTESGISENVICGYVYVNGEWKEAFFPLPDIIYNKIATYRAERGKKIKAVNELAFKNKIPFYNPHFFEKWQTFRMLQQNPNLQKYLPPTEPLSDIEQLNHFLHLYESAIIKPVLGNRGKGIYLVSKKQDYYELKTNKWIKSYQSLEDIWYLIKADLRNKKAIIQKVISLKKYKERPYDLRILVQRITEKWYVTGIGVRCAGQNKITTHIPHGGEIVPFEAVKDALNTKQIEDLATAIAIQLEISYGYLAEFSIDVGVDSNNHFWIFEVNSKPMKFDEIHIQEKAINTLIKCFYGDAGFL